MTHKDITAKERRIALQYRMGQLYNNKLGKRWRHTPTDACPLCAQPDGGHHIASGCPRLNKMYTARHHAAGRIILKAILQGERAAEVAYADVGDKEHLKHQGIPVIDKRHKLKLPKKSTRPDIILTSRTRTTQPSGPPTNKITHITLVEIKYSRDSDPQPQLQRAHSQHTKLQARLSKKHKCQVDTLPILLGVTGAIYQDHTSQPLQVLGITKKSLRKTLRLLHGQAIRSLTSIVSTRRCAEKKMGKNPHKRACTTAPGANSMHECPGPPHAIRDPG